MGASPSSPSVVSTWMSSMISSGSSFHLVQESDTRSDEQAGQPTQPLKPGRYEFRLFHRGEVRSALVCVPPWPPVQRPNSPAKQQRGEAGDSDFSDKHNKEAESEAAATLSSATENGQNPKLPVVFVFHGGGGNAAHMHKYTQMEALGAMKGFISVFPNGSGRMAGRLLTWNCEPGKCGYSADNQVDDVGFIMHLLDMMLYRCHADPARVYATGLSNGAMFCYRLASDPSASTRFAAIAPVAGACVCEPTFGPLRPVPILHIHSQDDPRALFQGGMGPPFPLTHRSVDHPPVTDVLRKWVEHNECRQEPLALDHRQTVIDGLMHTATLFVHQPLHPPDTVSSAQSDHAPSTNASSEAAEPYSAGMATVSTQLYQRYANQPVVMLWKLTSAGHVWPSASNVTLGTFVQRLCGTNTNVIDANMEIWQFFKQYSLEDKNA